jgi:ATP-binding cassette subfamily B protein
MGEPGGGRRSFTLYDLQRPASGHQLRQLPGLLLGAVQVLWQSAPHEFVLNAALQLASGAAYGLQLVLVKELIGAIQTASGSGGLTPVLFWLGAIGLVTLFTSFSSSVQFELQRVLGELVNGEVAGRMFDVVATADMEAFETPEFHDHLERAWNTGIGRPMQLTQALLGLMSAVAGVVGVAAGLFAVLPILVPVLLVGAVPILLFTTRSAKVFYDFAFGTTPIDRQRIYISRLLTHRRHAHEVIAFGLASWLTGRWFELHGERLARLRRITRPRIALAVAAALATSLLLTVPTGVVALLVVRGAMALPQAIAAATGVLLLRPTLQAVITNATQLYECALYLDDYRRFIAMRRPPAAATSLRRAPSGFSRLTVEGAAFTYPTASEPALDGISLEIEAGEVVALVGENGSGKTTLAKLLCGLYAPERGRVTWDGVDTREIESEDLRRSVAVLFQDFCQYFLSVRENVGVGDVDRIQDLPAVRRAAERSGADGFVAPLPQGYETLLGPEFEGGHELSVGQWQRIALSRAFMREATFVILDEPTASLDARAEHELFESIRGLVRGRTVLLISHRFSSVRSADRIYVLDRGRLVEEGTHEQLTASQGLYAELFELQARAYGP